MSATQTTIDTLRHQLAQSQAEVGRLQILAQTVDLFIREGMRMTPDGLIVREYADKSDPHYALCTAWKNWKDQAALAPRMKITVNGIEHTVPADQPLTYESIFAVAYPGKPFRLGATIVYFWRGDGDAERSGSIHVGKKIQPIDGMRVTCVFTGNA